MSGSVPRRPGATDGPGPLSALEQTVLAAMFRDDMFAPLRTQLARAAVVSRTHSGVGFVTRLAVPDDAPALPGVTALRPLVVRHPALEEPAEFLLQLREGRLATLEAFCAVGSWPADESAFRVPG